MSRADAVEGLDFVMRQKPAPIKMVHHRFYKSGSFWATFEVIESGERFNAEFYRVVKLSGVVRYRLAVKKQWRQILEDSIYGWAWLYKPAARFQGAIVDGHEQGVMIVSPFTEENS